MPKVKGPLLSVSASGTYRGLLEFRTTGDTTTVAGPRQIKPARSQAQQQQASRFQTAITGWNALATEDKNLWKAAAESLNLNGYQFYLSEYQSQNIVPPGQPIIP